MAVRDYGRFVFEFLRDPVCVGGIAPSSQQLALRMVDWIDWESASTVVEYGPGTGPFTAPILERKHPDAKFFAVELNPQFAETLAGRFPGVTIVQDSVGNIEEISRQQGVSEIDAIICGLPWAAFSDSDQTEYLDAMIRVLKPGGQFATFAYLSGMALPSAHRLRRKLQSLFTDVKMSPTVWSNFPPAFVYQCRR